MTNKLTAKDALKIISNKLSELHLFPLDNRERTKANGFAVGGEHGKQFIIILGNNEGAKQTRLITEKIVDKPAITGVTYISGIYKSSRVKQQKTSLGLINRLANGNQCSFLVDDSIALENLIRWYATSGKGRESKVEKVTEIKSSATHIELSEDHLIITKV